MKHIHILGICGTFMGGIALLAREMGFRVSGSDKNVYPPMSTQLEQAGIKLMPLEDPNQFTSKPDLVVIGNALSRGNPAVEQVLNERLPYTSGPSFLADYILRDRWVLGVAGTHGKTSSSSMLAWILEYADLKPGFLIGGIPENFGLSARIGQSPYFVVEADEYDTAFFDKRSKFVHYKPRTVILNNLEFDHADIFPDLDAIKRQFHHLVRTIPGNGLILLPESEANLNSVLEMGCWTPVETFGKTKSASWWTHNTSDDGSQFDVMQGEQFAGTLSWPLIGAHNVHNAMMAIAAANHAGVSAKIAIDALAQFKNVKRRMEVIGCVNGITIYDDFAHHPTAIETTLNGLRNKVGDEKIIAILEPRSQTMRMGIHKDTLASALADASEVLLFQPPSLDWDLQQVATKLSVESKIFDKTELIIDYICKTAKSGDHILIMSNGAFDGLHKKILNALQNQ
jgi:UDP-N-acetylmuramate: L-alanyl-gamma-D-glutamyl-meso-diaminopimelate ligase